MDHPVDLVLVAADAFTEVVATPAVADGVMYLRTSSHLFSLGGSL